MRDRIFEMSEEEEESRIRGFLSNLSIGLTNSTWYSNDSRYFLLYGDTIFAKGTEIYKISYCKSKKFRY